MSDRERAEQMADEHIAYAMKVGPPLREWIADALVEARAEEAERAKIDCTCEPFWEQYGKTDPRCEAHDLADEQKRRAVELRAQKTGGKV